MTFVRDKLQVSLQIEVICDMTRARNKLEVRVETSTGITHPMC